MQKKFSKIEFIIVIAMIAILMLIAYSSVNAYICKNDNIKQCVNDGKPEYECKAIAQVACGIGHYQN